MKRTNNPECQILKDGRVYIEHGPVSMVVMASKSAKVLTGLCLNSFEIVKQALAEIAGGLGELTRYPDQINMRNLEGLPLRMVKAVKQVEEPTLTPMATVAGVISDTVADWLKEQGADKVIVNNGGDIALRLEEGQTVRMGIQSNVNGTSMETIVWINAKDHIGGVCTSGLGGRSFTRGIANAVTIFSDRCILADACATHIANSSYVESPNVHTALAGNLRTDSDIADLSVVTKVVKLNKREIEQGLGQIQQASVRQIKKGNLKYVFADICGTKFQWPASIPIIAAGNNNHSQEIKE